MALLAFVAIPRKLHGVWAFADLGLNHGVEVKTLKVEALYLFKDGMNVNVARLASNHECMRAITHFHHFGARKRHRHPALNPVGLFPAFLNFSDDLNLAFARFWANSIFGAFFAA